MTHIPLCWKCAEKIPHDQCVYQHHQAYRPWQVRVARTARRLLLTRRIW